MAKSLVSWVLVGILTFAWYWVGYAWSYLQDIPRGNWSPVWMLFTVMIIVIHRRSGMAALGGNVVETMIGRIKAFSGHIVGFVVANFAGLGCWTLYNGSFIANEFVQGVVVCISCIVITSAFLGAMDDATQ